MFVRKFADRIQSANETKFSRRIHGIHVRERAAFADGTEHHTGRAMAQPVDQLPLKSGSVTDSAERNVWSNHDQLQHAPPTLEWGGTTHALQCSAAQFQPLFDWPRRRSMRPTTARRTHTSWVGGGRKWVEREEK